MATLDYSYGIPDFPVNVSVAKENHFPGDIWTDSKGEMIYS